MSKIVMGSTGCIIRGHVLDVNAKSLERALKHYDKQLYLRWNPKKMKGWGCWEVRAKPLLKEIVDYAWIGNMTIAQVEYKELDVINHVMDVPYLNYDVLNKIKSMDTWAKYGISGAKLDKDMHDKAEEYATKRREQANKEKKHYAKEFKRELSDFREAILSGTNPADIAKYWNK